MYRVEYRSIYAKWCVIGQYDRVVATFTTEARANGIAAAMNQAVSARGGRS